MSHSRKNSVRDKVIDNNWIYLERSAPQSVGHLGRRLQPQNMARLGFIGVGSFIG